MNDRFQRGRAASTIFYHPQTRVRVVLLGDDFTFAATESELRKARSKMSKWYDTEVRGIQDGGKRDVREMQILGRNVRWSDEGLEYEASDKHRQALMEGLALSKESKNVNSTAVKPEEIRREGDEEMLDGTEKTDSGAGRRRMNHMSLDRSDVQ